MVFFTYQSVIYIIVFFLARYILPPTQPIKPPSIGLLLSLLEVRFSLGGLQFLPAWTGADLLEDLLNFAVVAVTHGLAALGIVTNSKTLLLSIQLHLVPIAYYYARINGLDMFRSAE